MNPVNIQRAIDILKRAEQNQCFNPAQTWQWNPHSKKGYVAGQEVCMTEGELIRRGFQANFFGLIAISDEFQRDGGRADDCGIPNYRGLDNDLAIANWLGLSVSEAQILYRGGAVPVNSKTTRLTEARHFGKPIEDVTPTDYIGKLETYLHHRHAA